MYTLLCCYISTEKSGIMCQSILDYMSSVWVDRSGCGGGGERQTHQNRREKIVGAKALWYISIFIK